MTTIARELRRSAREQWSHLQKLRDELAAVLDSSRALCDEAKSIRQQAHRVARDLPCSDRHSPQA